MAIMRMDEVVQALQISRTTLWRRVRAGQFPPPLRLGGAGSRAIGWRRTDVERWVDELRLSAEID